MDDERKVKGIHVEDKLGGLVEAALDLAMEDEGWLEAMAEDPNIDQTTIDECYQALESYLCDHLARVLHDPSIELHTWPMDVDLWDSGPIHEATFDYTDSYDDYDQWVSHDNMGHHLELRIYNRKVEV